MATRSKRAYRSTEEESTEENSRAKRARILDDAEASALLEEAEKKLKSERATKAKAKRRARDRDSDSDSDADESESESEGESDSDVENEWETAAAESDAEMEHEEEDKPEEEGKDEKTAISEEYLTQLSLPQLKQLLGMLNVVGRGFKCNGKDGLVKTLSNKPLPADKTKANEIMDQVERWIAEIAQRKKAASERAANTRKKNERNYKKWCKNKPVFGDFVNGSIYSVKFDVESSELNRDFKLHVCFELADVSTVYGVDFVSSRAEGNNMVLKDGKFKVFEKACFIKADALAQCESEADAKELKALDEKQAKQVAAGKPARPHSRFMGQPCILEELTLQQKEFSTINMALIRKPSEKKKPAKTEIPCDELVTAAHRFDMKDVGDDSSRPYLIDWMRGSVQQSAGPKLFNANITFITNLQPLIDVFAAIAPNFDIKGSVYHIVRDYLATNLITSEERMLL